MSTNGRLKLHLGCGERRLDGYLNVDFPLSSHSAQKVSVADLHCDITALCHAPGSVMEVRLHHVFEHFRRPVACGLLASWNRWLEPEGRVHIEVPDLQAMARILANPFTTSQARGVAERHLFGSHEADWAAHYEAYDAKLLSLMLETFGFSVVDVIRTKWLGIRNLEVIAVKRHGLDTADEARRKAEEYLRHFLVDETPGELTMLRVWLEGFDAQLQRGWGEQG